MNTQNKTQVKFVYSEVAQQAIEIGRKNHMIFNVIGYGEVPNRPFYRGKWWFEPVKEIPEIAQSRISILMSAGITFKGFVIGHEIELVERKEEKTDFKINPSIPASNISASDLTSALAKGLGLALLATLFFPLLLLDPAIIAVLDDGTWLEIMTYYQ